jgi:hypothetical protein
MEVGDGSGIELLVSETEQRINNNGASLSRIEPKLSRS